MRVPTKFENPLCSEIDTELFFPTNGEQAQAEAAKRICKKCPHLAECFEWALNYERFGVWGGTSPRERQRIRTKHNLKLKDNLVA